MIYYEHAWQVTGSVFPAAAKVALPSALVTLALSTLLYFDVVPHAPWPMEADDLGGIFSGLTENAAWTGFSTLVGFLVVFRTSQAYSRFWDGCTATYMMQTEWFDACSSIVAFCKHSKQPEEKILSFQNLLVRLFSMLHALALAEIEDSGGDEEIAAFNYELIDIEAIDTESLRTLKSSECKVELVFQWIQQLLVENIDCGVLSIPPPILSRAFQELATGMVQFHDALKISCIPFPFPYAQTCDVLLMLHSLGTPFVMVQWVSKPWWAFFLSFMQVFILWCLNYIAIEIQNPFGSDANDIDAAAMQNSMNTQLLLLLQPSTKRTPKLKQKVMVQLNMPSDQKEESTFKSDFSKKSFSSIFTDLDVRRRSSLDSTAGSTSQGPEDPSMARGSLRMSTSVASGNIFGGLEDETYSSYSASSSNREGGTAALGSDGNQRSRGHHHLHHHHRQEHDLIDLQQQRGGGWHDTMKRLAEAKGVEPEAVGRPSHYKPRPSMGEDIMDQVDNVEGVLPARLSGAQQRREDTDPDVR